MEARAGEVIVRLELDWDLTLRYLRAGPGEGSRTASVNLKPHLGCQEFQLYLVWGPEEIRIHIGNVDGTSKQLLEGSSKSA
jgi:hypothetical protein